ncbi:MAG: hypothetical protein PWP23_3282 [Candidatus Sumerlaeota bacterium]|nr:hypothetical protein [Candidatus Sumerlaeota bacterium]
MTSPGRLHDERNVLLDRETRRLRRFWLHPGMLVLLACVWGGALFVGLRGERLLPAHAAIATGNLELQRGTIRRTARSSGIRPMNPAVFQAPRFSRRMTPQWNRQGEPEVDVAIEQRPFDGRDYVLAEITANGKAKRHLVLAPRPRKGELFECDVVFVCDGERIELAVWRADTPPGQRAWQERWLAERFSSGISLPPRRDSFPASIKWVRQLPNQPLDSVVHEYVSYETTSLPHLVFLSATSEAMEYPLLVPFAFYGETELDSSTFFSATVAFFVPPARYSAVQMIWDIFPCALMTLWVVFAVLLPIPLARRMTRFADRYGADTLRVTFADDEIVAAVAGSWRRAWACWLGAMLAPVLLVFVAIWARLGPVFVLPPFRSRAVAETLLEPDWFGPLAIVLLLAGVAAWGMLISVLAARWRATIVWQGLVTFFLAMVLLPGLHLLLGVMPNSASLNTSKAWVAFAGYVLVLLGALAWWMAGRAARRLWRETLAAQSEGAHHE